ncbi:MAG TPA: hypothetical protein VJU87_10195 [Gemmatimonadaceae bacterium]|nr:hypothetical protein [Gemmatimonadaceae bacterium]
MSRAPVSKAPGGRAIARRDARDHAARFEFDHDGRRYCCSREARAGGARELWWWFTVSGDGQRYAPFEAAAGEPQESVQARVIAFHVALLEHRANPPAAHQAWWQRRRLAAQSPLPSAGADTT